ncbi:MAG: tetratricopeptide repeat protein [Hyphomicrobiaceae bacterium]|nr:tetratricopeptide repeat protein [Hyphomicrobiaceae bacterium]
MAKVLTALLALVLLTTTPARADDEADCRVRGDWPTIVRGCSGVIARTPREAWPYINRSWALERLKRFEEALADADQALRLDPRAAIAYVNRAAALIGLKRYDLALEDCESALQIDSRNVLAYLNRGYAYEQLRRRDLAIEAYRQALALQPGHAYAQQALKRLGASP